MPFYEYECSGCKYYTEVLQKLSDPVLRKCPSCGKNSFKKLVSAPVFRLKGSGWYETDFKGDKDSKRNLAGDDSRPPDGKDKDAKDKDGNGPDGKGKDGKDSAEPAKKPSPPRPRPPSRRPRSRRRPRRRRRARAAANLPAAARPRREGAAAKSPAKAAKKKARR